MNKSVVETIIEPNAIYTRTVRDSNFILNWETSKSIGGSEVDDLEKD